MTEMFLNPQELKELTGFSQKAAQIRNLLKNDIEHFVRGDGRASVPKPVRKNAPVVKARPTPRFEALQARQ